MQNYDPGFQPFRVSDDTSLGAPAANAKQRRAALDYCLTNDWAAADIGKLERSDTGSFHGWLMWPYIP